MAKVVEPKRQKLREAEEKLQAANQQLMDKQAALQEVIARVQDLQKQLADAQSEQRKLNDQVRREISCQHWYCCSLKLGDRCKLSVDDVALFTQWQAKLHNIVRCDSCTATSVLGPTLAGLAVPQADLTRLRLDRAGKLTSGLADEGVRWQATADQLQGQTDLLVGDVFLSAACIAYYGAFTGSYR